MNQQIVYGIVLQPGFSKKDVELLALSSVFFMKNNPERFYQEEEHAIKVLGQRNRKWVPHFYQTLNSLMQQLNQQGYTLYHFDQARFCFELHPEISKVLGHYMISAHYHAASPDQQPSLNEFFGVDQAQHRATLIEIIKQHCQDDRGMAQRLIQDMDMHHGETLEAIYTDKAHPLGRKRLSLLIASVLIVAASSIGSYLLT